MIWGHSNHRGSTITPPGNWSPEQVVESKACYFLCIKLGVEASQVAVLLFGHHVVDMECVKPTTSKLYHMVMQDQACLDGAKDDQERRIFSMMLECSTLLFMHALDEDIFSWNLSRSVL